MVNPVLTIQNYFKLHVSTLLEGLLPNIYSKWTSEKIKNKTINAY